MFSSSVLNSVTFKDLANGTLPNKWNTLHEDRKHGAFTVVPYCQRFNKNDTIYLQFVSDSDTAPELKSYIPALNETINPDSISSYIGDDERYYFNFEVELGATYYDKEIYFIVTQDSDVLTSEPIKCEDLSEDIAKGILKKVKYTNSDRENSDLDNYFVDWSILDYMYFYIEASDLDQNNSDESDILEGSQSNTIISATLFSGLLFKTEGIPDYLCLKLAAVSSLDVFEINEIEYVKNGALEVDRMGNSTLFQATLKLTEKNTIGINVDDLGITQTESDMPIINRRNTAVTGSGWSVENPEGYHLHAVWIKHAATSAADEALVALGTSISGDDLIDFEMGTILKSEHLTTWAQFPQHYLKNPDASSNLYFSVSGSGAILDILVQFETVTEIT